jgi:hypothetical protein
MRLIVSFGLVLVVTPVAIAQQAAKDERQFGISLNSDFYPQDSPKNTMTSLIRALDKERYDYIVAHLLNPAYVDEQLRAAAPTFENEAREHVAREGLDKKGFTNEFIRERVRQLAAQENFANLVRRVKATLEGSPESVKELRKLAREGEVIEGGESTSVKHKEIKDRALFMRNILGRWYLENKMQE